MRGTEQILPVHNRILAALPHQELESIYPYLQVVSLTRGETLFDVGEQVSQAYFVTSGIVSLLSVSSGGETVEVAMVGREGLVGTTGILNVNRTPWRAKVEIDTTALQIEREALRAESQRNQRLRDLILCYAHTMVTQFSQTVICNLFHSMEQRLARWLLMAHDRAGADSLVLTHQDISEMLGASRGGVSSAAGVLQKSGLIRYARGRITILSRERLEAAACECYQVIRDDLDFYLPLTER